MNTILKYLGIIITSITVSCASAQTDPQYSNDDILAFNSALPVIDELNNKLRAKDYNAVESVAINNAMACSNASLASFYYMVASAAQFAEGDESASTATLKSAFLTDDVQLAVSKAYQLALDMQIDNWYQQFRESVFRDLDKMSSQTIAIFAENDVNYAIHRIGWSGAAELVVKLKELKNPWLTTGLKNATLEMWTTARNPTANLSETLDIMNVMVALFPEIQRESNYRYNRASLLNMQDRHDEALQEYQAAEKLASFPQEKANAYYGLMNAYKESGNYKMAAQYAKELLSITSRHGGLNDLRQQAVFMVDDLGEENLN